MQIQSIVITHEIVVCEMGLPRSYLELVREEGPDIRVECINHILSYKYNSSCTLVQT